MSGKSHIEHPHKRKGTSQTERFPLALREDYVKIDERNLHDLIAQTAELSKYIKFYESSSTHSDGDWSAFFEEVYDATTKHVKVKNLEELEVKSNTSPHLSLFIAFLKLYQLSLDQLNTLSEKHLMFFYEKMLRLKPKSALSPQVTLIGELAKDVATVIIPKGCFFKAGKSKLGEELVFITDQDVILNKASVGALRTLNLLNTKIKQRNIANSFDGNGAEITNEPKSWSAFGQQNDQLTEIGFCIASPFFGVNEGNRTLTISITNVDFSVFDVFISVQNGWEKLKRSESAINQFKADIPVDFPKIISINQEIHGLRCDSQFPVLKFVIKDSSTDQYIKYKNAEAKFTLSIDYKQIRQLSVKNEFGRIDVSKPFQPFGNTPSKLYSELIIGHPFLFNKYSSNVMLLVDGKKVTDIMSPLYLNNGAWDAKTPKVFDPVFDKEYAITTRNNYIKLKYAGSYTKAKDVTIVVEKINEKSQTVKVTIPEDNIPIWKDLAVDAKISFNQDQREAFEFYHLHPFEVERRNTFSRLLPAYDRMSYFWIGIDNLHVGQSLTLHFELLEGSGNQDVNHPKVSWLFKNGGEISSLNNSEIIKDTTLKFLQSGIVQFALRTDRFPLSINEHDDKLWLIAACDKSENAIAEFIDVFAQAFAATYVIPENQYIENIVPESIKKIEVSINGLKKIKQPYSSFGGRDLENKDGFVIRSSERLRHKGVAINYFDYERILLQEFSFLYQVKCISHSTTTSQAAPGHILVIVVPQLKHDKSQIDLQPKVSVGNREAIKLYLEKKSSPFAKIEVRNPHYQEIMVNVNVKYLPAFDPNKEYYNSILNKRLQTYIAPWIEQTQVLEFNKVSYKARYINFIEEQEFVDNINFFELYINGVKVNDNIESVREDVIFTSASNHIIRNEELC